MGLPAMARITKVPEEKLVELARSNPVFAPGPENYLRMGGLQAIWHDNLAARLADAIANAPRDDQRSALGLQRGGRKAAQPVIEAIIGGGDVRTA
jgi:malonate decarboxylase gamma subunit